MLSDDKDSLGKLIDDMEQVAAPRACACRYFGKQEGDDCNGCPARGKRCYEFVFNDLARRLHALMPHDRKGVEIKPGDTIKNAIGLQMNVTDVMPLPVSIRDDTTGHVTTGVPHLWSVVRPDSWERLEEDATMLPHDYLTAKDTSDKRYGTEALTAMTTDLVRRAKALAGVE